MKYTFYLIAFLVLHQPAYSQDYIYDDMNISAVDIGFMAGTYNDVWTVTHGTPTYTAAGSKIYMWYFNGARQGEGIVRKFDFKPNRIYKVYIGIEQIISPSTTGALDVRLVNSYPEYHYDPGDPFTQGSAIPSFPGSRSLFDNTVASSSTFQTLLITFKTGADESYNGIAIYPKQTAFHDDRASVTITCIGIRGCISMDSGGETICESIIPPGLHSFYSEINVGSKHCTNVTLTQNNTDENTVIESATSILISDNTLLAGSQNGYAEIVIGNGCSQTTMSELPPPLEVSSGFYTDLGCGVATISAEDAHYSSQPDSVYNLDKQYFLNKIPENITLFPNPNVGNNVNFNSNVDILKIVLYNKFNEKLKEFHFDKISEGTLHFDDLEIDTYILEFHTLKNILRKKYVKL